MTQKMSPFHYIPKPLSPQSRHLPAFVKTGEKTRCTNGLKIPLPHVCSSSWGNILIVLKALSNYTSIIVYFFSICVEYHLHPSPQKEKEREICLFIFVQPSFPSSFPLWELVDGCNCTLAKLDEEGRGVG